jgi:hypothetical protein
VGVDVTAAVALARLAYEAGECVPLIGTTADTGCVVECAAGGGLQRQRGIQDGAVHQVVLSAGPAPMGP